MTPSRAGISLLLVGLVCLAVVFLRAERVRLEARAEGHVATLLEHRRHAWSLQMEFARLRTPRQIRARVARWEVALSVPEAGEASHFRSVELAKNDR